MPLNSIPPSLLSVPYHHRSYALQHAGVKVIWDAGNDIFKRQLEQLADVLGRIIAGLLASVESYRCGLCEVWSDECRYLCCLAAD